MFSIFVPLKMYIYFPAVVLFTLSTLNVLVGAVDSKTYCYAHDPHPYRDFGTSALYEFVRGNIEIPEGDRCKPAFVAGLVRSGVRYYNGYNTERLGKLQKQIVENHTVKNLGFLSEDDLALVKSWTSLGTGKTSDDPALSGRVESSNLGRTLGQKFKDLFANNAGNLRFQTSSSLTARESAAAFIDAMIPDQTSVNIDMSENDNLLRFIENSEQFEHRVTKNAYDERDNCVRSPPMQTLKKDVSERLGFTEIELSDQSIADLYFACAFESAWAPNTKIAFCASFTKQQQQLLEYCYMDVLGYNEWGYGSAYAVQFYNPILAELLSKLQTASLSEKPQLKGEFLFASAAALTHTVTKLGLYPDEEPLRADNYGPARKHEQKWSMTKICPFSGNLIFVLQNCGAADSKVSVYHNERLVQIPGCSSSLCPWKEFQDAVLKNNKKV